MKQLHRKDLFAWSEFNEERNLDFHSVLWRREQGNVLIDPLPLSDHDARHLQSLGGASIIIITNSGHCRDAENIAKLTGASIYGPAGEQTNFPIACSHWISGNEEIVQGLHSYRMEGSKTPGELALVLEKNTLITGDLVRCHIGGELCLLPEIKLTDKKQAHQSVLRLASLSDIKTVLNGDGWPIFHNGNSALLHLAESLESN